MSLFNVLRYDTLVTCQNYNIKLQVNKQAIGPGKSDFKLSYLSTQCSSKRKHVCWCWAQCWVVLLIIELLIKHLKNVPRAIRIRKFCPIDDNRLAPYTCNSFNLVLSYLIDFHNDINHLHYHRTFCFLQIEKSREVFTCVLDLLANNYKY